MDARYVSAARRTLGAVLMSAALSGCCQREVVSQFPSPSESQVLVIVRRNCAAFDSFATEVRLRNGAGTRNNGLGERMASMHGAPILQVTWQDDSSVIVFAPSRTNVHIVKSEFGGVRLQVRE